MLGQASNRNGLGRERRPQEGREIAGNLIRCALQRRVHFEDARAEFTRVCAQIAIDVRDLHSDLLECICLGSAEEWDRMLLEVRALMPSSSSHED